MSYISLQTECGDLVSCVHIMVHPLSEVTNILYLLALVILPLVLIG